MADYVFRYRLQSAPQARNDGSGQVAHSIVAVSSPDGEEWSIVPAHSKTFLVPSDDLEAVMDMPDATGPERQAKNAAYKELLKDNRFTAAQPMRTDWTAATMEQFMDANDAAALEAGKANEYITVTLGQDYPVDFSL